MGLLVSDKRHEVYYQGVRFVLRELAWGDEMEVTRNAMRLDVNKGEADVDLARFQEMRLLRALEDWDLVDEEGNKVPINLENLRRLRGDVARFLLAEVDRMNTLSMAEKKSNPLRT